MKRTQIVGIPKRQTLAGAQPKIAITIIDIPGIWNVRPLAEQASITLRDWKIIEVDGNAKRFGRHFVGYNEEDGEGRVSSKIAEFDPAQRRGRTSSGRVYQLEGPPGSNDDADYVLSVWLRLHGAAKHRVLEAIDA